MKVAIAGAGVGGLAVGALLAREGYQVEIFDQFETPAPVGSGLMLQETGLTVLAAMGLRAQAEARGSVINRLFGRSVPSGRTVLDVRFKALSASLCAIGIQRSALFTLLYEAACTAGAAFTGGVDITGVDAQGGALLCRAGRRLGPFDLIVDGLGANSPLSMDVSTALPFGALWASVPWPQGEAFNDTALEQRYRTARQMTGIMPSGVPEAGTGPTATYFWSLEGDAYGEWKTRGLSAWQAQAEMLWPETAELVSELGMEDLTFARYRHRTWPRPVEGKLVHIGDSWHATSPQLGQGANMALLDAYGLYLGLRAHPGNLPAALADYLDRRSTHVRLYQVMSFLFTPVYQSRGSLLPALRDWVAAPLSRVPPAPAVLAALVSGSVGRPLHRLKLV
ncbi:MAG: FAD-dependent monooxygenase [Hyphomonadaceae bacterium]|nr:FAD-dependent monooxygenase [Hyphomonadaceae bacterium]